MNKHSARTAGQERSYGYKLTLWAPVCDVPSGPLLRLDPGERLAQARLLDPVDADALAVDLDHGDPGPVGTLELRVAGDVDLGELEVELAAQAFELAPGARAKLAAGREVERDAAQG
jgi:hypothetical protein